MENDRKSSLQLFPIYSLPYLQEIKANQVSPEINAVFNCITDCSNYGEKMTIYTWNGNWDRTGDGLAWLQQGCPGSREFKKLEASAVAEQQQLTHISHPLFRPDIRTCFLLPFPVSLLSQKAALVENEET